ncbi:hypothetical protein ABZS86_24290 [Streptomyces sp. NPDC005355]|uniref:hypothetical protein n=1 Tax=Streptomyces sp. NPDC005355 TaxID=3157038 RepID=UPI0033BDC896
MADIRECPREEGRALEELVPVIRFTFPRPQPSAIILGLRKLEAAGLVSARLEVAGLDRLMRATSTCLAAVTLAGLPAALALLPRRTPLWWAAIGSAHLGRTRPLRSAAADPAGAGGRGVLLPDLPPPASAHPRGERRMTTAAADRLAERCRDAGLRVVHNEPGARGLRALVAVASP